jgi:hypothetical protein
MESPTCAEVRADQQDVVIGVDGGHDPRRGRAERGGSVDLLQPGILIGRPVGQGPQAGRGAGGATVEVGRRNGGGPAPASRASTLREVRPLRADCSVDRADSASARLGLFAAHRRAHIGTRSCGPTDQFPPEPRHSSRVTRRAWPVDRRDKLAVRGHESLGLAYWRAAGRDFSGSGNQGGHDAPEVKSFGPHCGGVTQPVGWCSPVGVRK